MDKPFRIKTITELHRLAKVPPPMHPLISIVRLEDLPELPNDYPTSFIYEFYTIGFKKNLKGYVEYGRKKYDFQEGVLAFTAPNQVLSYANSDNSEATGWLIFFQKELLIKSALLEKISNYQFFSYAVNEALHLSAEEEQKIQGIIENLYAEYIQPIDNFSKEVMVSNLDLLMTYGHRYYKRQFVTRLEVDNAPIEKFSKLLDVYFTKSAMNEGLPSVEYFAEKLNLSSSYLSDFLKVHTGKSTKEHIHSKIIELAKEKLSDTSKSISQVAYELGVEYPQYFSRLCKEKEGLSPKDYINN